MLKISFQYFPSHLTQNYYLSKPISARPRVKLETEIEMSSDLSVKVAVRVRPLVESEKNRGCQNIARKTPNQPQVVVNSGSKKNELFTYNYVFTPEDTQETVYENSIKTMVTKLFKGYNVTILAYGQT